MRVRKYPQKGILMKKLLGISLITSLALAGCAASPSASSSSNLAQSSSASGNAITVGLTYIPDIQFAPFYVAEDQGYFTDEGLDVTLRHHGSQESLLGALQAGQEDVVFAGGDEMMQARSQGTDVVDWATMYQKYPIKLISLASATEPGLQASDIRGTTIGLPGPYGANYFALLAMLDAQGLTEKDVSVQYIGYTQTAALLGGDVDAVIGYTNSDAVAIQAALTDAGRTETVVEADMVPGGLPLVGVGLGSLASNLDANKASYTKMLRALSKAVDFAEKNPEKTVEIAAQYVPSLAEKDAQTQAKAVLKATLALYQGSATFGEQDAQLWENMSSFMEQNNLLAKPVDASSAFVDLTK
jgi:NitT/TauT family transport system substrate-binding protein